MPRRDNSVTNVKFQENPNVHSLNIFYFISLELTIRLVSQNMTCSICGG